MSPGGYLLSRDLSSDYHRRADVSLPGSEWDRVGPSGYDHQVARSFTLLSVAHRLSGRSFFICRSAVLLLDEAVLLVLMKRMLTSAWRWFWVISISCVLSSHIVDEPSFKLFTGGDVILILNCFVYEVNRMLVVLG